MSIDQLRVTAAGSKEPRCDRHKSKMIMLRNSPFYASIGAYAMGNWCISAVIIPQGRRLQTLIYLKVPLRDRGDRARQSGSKSSGAVPVDAVGDRCFARRAQFVGHTTLTSSRCQRVIGRPTINDGHIHFLTWRGRRCNCLRRSAGIFKQAPSPFDIVIDTGVHYK